MTFGTPSLVATDLDGTVVRPDGTVSARTLAAFARVESAGARFVLVTGRPPRLMARIADAFGGRGTAICSNGALIYDLADRKVVGENPIQPPELAEAARRLRSAIPGIGLAVEFADAIAGDQAYEADVWDSDVGVRRLADDELFGAPAPKLVGRHPELSADELLALAKPALDGLVTAYHSNGTRLVEAIALGVDKGAAVAQLAERQGLTAADVVAFGDMPNDLPLLAWAGTSFGVAGAHPDVLAAVDHVIGGIEDDGVAEVLERMFPGPGSSAQSLVPSAQLPSAQLSPTS